MTNLPLINLKLDKIKEKDDEIKRFKKGYDADIFHNFLLRFTRVDRNMRGYLAREGN